MRRRSEVFSYSRASLFAPKRHLADTVMGVAVANEYRLLQLFLHMSGNWHE